MDDGSFPGSRLTAKALPLGSDPSPLTPDPFLLLWLIDDTPQHHATAAATAAQVPGVHFAGFMSAEEGLDAFRTAVRSKVGVPDVVLMDFFLGDDRGDRVTAQLRRLESATKRPVIIGYSSVASGSIAIIEAGGDLSLKKQRGDDGTNPALLEWLRHATAQEGDSPA